MTLEQQQQYVSLKIKQSMKHEHEFIPNFKVDDEFPNNHWCIGCETTELHDFSNDKHLIECECGYKREG